MAKEQTTTTKKDEVLTIEGKGRDNLGIDNKGTLVITGNVGDIVGVLNEGTIIVIGNAGNAVGYRNYGTIIVNGTIKELDKKASGTIIAGDVKKANGRPWLNMAIKLNAKTYRAWHKE